MTLPVRCFVSESGRSRRSLAHDLPLQPHSLAALHSARGTGCRARQQPSECAGASSWLPPPDYATLPVIHWLRRESLGEADVIIVTIIGSSVARTRARLTPAHSAVHSISRCRSVTSCSRSCLRLPLPLPPMLMLMRLRLQRKKRLNRLSLFPQLFAAATDSPPATDSHHLPQCLSLMRIPHPRQGLCVCAFAHE